VEKVSEESSEPETMEESVEHELDEEGEDK
jgi:hypothetical protein